MSLQNKLVAECTDRFWALVALLATRLKKDRGKGACK